jgi:hypothetical protein
MPDMPGKEGQNAALTSRFGSAGSDASRPGGMKAGHGVLHRACP